MTVYIQEQINDLYEKNLRDAKRKLSTLQVYCGKEPVMAGLNGWVYERTIQYCLGRELRARGNKTKWSSKRKLAIESKLISKLAMLPLRLSGLAFLVALTSPSSGSYNKVANILGLHYLYLTGNEGYLRYRNGIIAKLGKESGFFLDTPREWARFVSRIAHLLLQKT